VSDEEQAEVTDPLVATYLAWMAEVYPIYSVFKWHKVLMEISRRPELLRNGGANLLKKVLPRFDEIVAELQGHVNFPTKGSARRVRELLLESFRLTRATLHLVPLEFRRQAAKRFQPPPVLTSEGMRGGEGEEGGSD